MFIRFFVNAKHFYFILMILDRSLYTVFRNNIFRTRRLSETMPSFLPSVLVKPDQQDYEFTGYLEEEKEYAKENKSVDEAQIVNIDEYIFDFN